MNKKTLKLIQKLGLCLIFVFYFQFVFTQEQFKNDKFVIVLDVQQYWTDNSLSDNASKEMINSINRLITISNPEKVIYIKTLMAEKVLSISFRGIKVDTIYADAFDSTLSIVNNLIFEKTQSDAFATNIFQEYLIKNEAKDIIITGLLAERCVLNTVSGGVSRGYNIYVYPEAIGSKSKKTKRKVLNELKAKGCMILNFFE